MQAVETFYIGEFEVKHIETGFTEVGWYWWYCNSGCLPDSEAYGPYATAQAAQAAANEDRVA